MTNFSDDKNNKNSAQPTNKLRDVKRQSNGGKLRLVLWKNLILRKRHWMLSLFEIIIPIGLMSLIVFLRVLPNSSFLPKNVDEISNFTVASERDLKVILCQKSLGTWDIFHKRCFYHRDVLPGDMKLFWGPPNGFTQEMISLLRKELNFNESYLTNCSSNEEMNNLVDKSYFESNQSLRAFYIGVFFNLEDPESDKVPQDLNYDLRLQKVWFTEYIYPLLQIPGPRNYSITTFGASYTMDGFTLLQYLIDQAFMRILTNYSAEVDDYALETQMYPYPPYIQDHGLSQFYGSVLPTFIAFSLILLSPTLIKSIVYEKETGVRELVRMMGLDSWLIWLGWFMYSFSTLFIVAIVITCMLNAEVQSKNPEAGLVPAILAYSDPSLIWFILLLYGIAAICFCFALSCFFTKPTLATTIGVLVWLLSYFIPRSLMDSKYDSMGLTPKLFSCLLPNMAMTWAFRVIGMFEGRAIGITWDNLWDTGNPRDELTPAMIMIMLAVDIILYSTATWYVDQVLPGTYGVPLPWYFPFTKSYWVSSSRLGIRDEEKLLYQTFNPLNPSKNASYFEAEPQGLKVGIRVEGLRKEFRSLNKVKVAVDHVDLTCYEGQCTVLLGHNGAGKTTTMSVLTGVYPPTEGYAEVSGWNIRTHLKEARSQVGLCPQHNTLFSDLSVKQHLLFFARLKGLSSSEAKKETKVLLKRLELNEKKDQFGGQLSGGMKRKLCLAIALIGGSKVIILDEPSSGLDPESRRWVWDVVQQERGSRTVLVTTHHMEEADVLGDRVAIMADGRVVCCGSTLFLKDKFGDGYTLSATGAKGAQVYKIKNAIDEHIEGASLRNIINNTFQFRLPPKTHQFPELLDHLTTGKDGLGIEHIGLSLTTMEQVFLRVGDIVEKSKENRGTDGIVMGVLGSSAGVINATFVGDEDLSFNGVQNILRPGRPTHERQESTKSVQQYRERKLHGWPLIIERIRTLFIKKFIYSKRKWLLLTTQALIPVLVTLLCLAVDATFNEQNFMERPVTFDLDMFPESFSSVQFDDPSRNLKENYWNLFEPPHFVSESEDLYTTLLEESYSDLNKYREKCITSALFQHDNESKYTTTRMMYQSIPYHAPGIGMNLINNAVLKTILKNKENHTITTNNAPLPPNKSWQTDGDQTTYSSALYSMTMPIALAFLTSSFLVFPLSERVSSAKQIQLMTGTSPFLLWSTSYIWDLVAYMSSCLLIFICFMLFDSKGYFTAPGAPGALMLLLFLYGLCSIPMAYVFSFPFLSSASGFAVLALLNIVAGMIISTATLALKLADTANLIQIASIIGNVTSFIPAYPASKAFMSIVDMSNYNNICNVIDISVRDSLCQSLFLHQPNSTFLQCCPVECLDPSVGTGSCFVELNYLQWKYPGLGMYFMYFVVDFIFYFLILYLIESGLGDILSIYWYKLTTLFCKAKEIKVEREEIDDDVENEQTEVDKLIQQDNIENTAIVVKDLTKVFVKAGLVAVKGVSFHFNKGECFGLLGVNGAGKTTTFRMLTGDESRSSGDARINNNYLSHGRKRFMEEIGYCPQFDAIIGELTGEEMLSLMAGLRGVPKEMKPRLLKRLIHLVDLTECSTRPSSTYSGGNKRKLSTAMALVGQPPLVFLDEPTSGVDPASRRKVWEAVRDANKSGQSVVLTSHSMDECEALCSKVVIMARGSLKCAGSPQHLKAKFGQGYTLQVKVKSVMTSDLSNGTEEERENYYSIILTALKASICEHLPGSQLTDQYRGMLVYQVPSTLSWSLLFNVMENLKQGIQLPNRSDNSSGSRRRSELSFPEEIKNLIEDYAAMDPSLEQVFLSFARNTDSKNIVNKDVKLGNENICDTQL